MWRTAGPKLEREAMIGDRIYALRVLNKLTQAELGATTWNAINLTGRQRVVVSGLEPSPSTSSVLLPWAPTT